MTSSSLLVSSSMSVVASGTREDPWSDLGREGRSKEEIPRHTNVRKKVRPEDAYRRSSRLQWRKGQVHSTILPVVRRGGVGLMKSPPKTNRTTLVQKSPSPRETMVLTVGSLFVLQSLLSKRSYFLFLFDSSVVTTSK